MNITMSARGATPEDKQRGVDAAKEVFKREGVTAEEAAEAAFAFEGWDDMGFPPDQEPSEEVKDAAGVWWDASRTAIDACCVGWPDEKRIHVVGLELLHDPEAQLADRATALTQLRAIVRATEGKLADYDNRVFFLAEAATAAMADAGLARQLVSAVTCAFTPLVLAKFTPEEPIGPKRQAMLDTIDALEAGSALRN